MFIYLSTRSLNNLYVNDGYWHLGIEEELIIFEYLNYLKKNDKISFNKEVKRYKFYLDDKSCSKLGIPYIDHKKDRFVYLYFLKILPGYLQDLNLINTLWIKHLYIHFLHGIN